MVIFSLPPRDISLLVIHSFLEALQIPRVNELEDVHLGSHDNPRFFLAEPQNEETKAVSFWIEELDHLMVAIEIEVFRIYSVVDELFVEDRNKFSVKVYLFEEDVDEIALNIVWASPIPIRLLHVAEVEEMKHYRLAA